MRRNPYYSGPVSDHFDGRRFFNPGSDVADKTLRDIWRWRKTSTPTPWPSGIDIVPVLPERSVQDARVTLVGHATVLIQICGLNIVTDPLWSQRAGPAGFVGPKRIAPPAVAFNDLPRIDVVLLSHNHYDHLDVATLRRLVARDEPLIVTLLGNDAILGSAIPAARVEVGDWWDGQRLSDDVEVVIVPAHHWSARSLRDRRMAL
ncbi:hypothetical protein F9L08_06140 [Brucella tritici]|uniref:Metallo-beta-lactamase domain-containing protein n=1 Tax=Brucella tritici TaxID=94626 RepID=A0A6L3YUL7_9HYPH|nr:hypothetical protein F9L08_06140 [Brucella tritici]